MHCFDKVDTYKYVLLRIFSYTSFWYRKGIVLQGALIVCDCISFTYLYKCFLQYIKCTEQNFKNSPPYIQHYYLSVSLEILSFRVLFKIYKLAPQFECCTLTLLKMFITFSYISSLIALTTFPNCCFGPEIVRGLLYIISLTESHKI